MFERRHAPAVTLVPRPVDLSELLDRICVRPPYFALRELRVEDEEFCAVAAAEQPPGLEAGPMQAAEISRHAAIAGLCAAALAQGDPQRRYYLAQQATYLGTPSSDRSSSEGSSPLPYGTPLELRARLLELNKRQAQARIRVRAAGQEVAALEVLYTVLPDNAFARLFRSRHRPGFGRQPQPQLAPLPPGQLSREGGRLIQQVGRVPESACAGHFEGYPAMPVALLMGQLARLAGQALEGPFRVAQARVQARDFCWADESARFMVEPATLAASQVVFHCEAQANDRTVGQMQLFLDRV